MLWTLIRHELLMNLMTFRFLVTVIASMSLVLAGSIVLTDNYERRLASYNEDFQKHQEGNFSGKTYSSFMPRLDRAPNPLSVFNQGLDKRAKNSLQIKIGEVPLLYPNVSLFLVNRFIDTEERVRQADQAIDQTLEQFYWAEEVPGDPFENPPLLKGSEAGAGSSSYTHLKKNITFIPDASEIHVPTVKAYFQELTSGRIRTANKIWQIRETTFSETYILKSNIARNALRFSPAGLYHLSTEAWAGTGLARMQDFFTAGRQYRETVLDYFYDKKAFGSRQWFASDKGAVRWDDIPRFSYQPPGVLEGTSNRALRDLFLLFLFNPILLMIIFAVFSRQEV